ncbi:aldo/keto reductase [candidate division KSB1 bacterium]|nr:aldo/keto reductase [candidate division KSB1 bacterium]
MKYISLGNTELQVSRICFGTWQMSPRFWGEISDREFSTALRTAFDQGINFFDTADAYGDGLAETVLGKALGDVPRSRCILTTKVFNHFAPDGQRYPDLSPAHLQERCDASLQRLHTDYIDLYLLHFYDQLTPLVEITATLDRLREMGKIRYYGVSNFSIEELRAARQVGNFSVLQTHYNFFYPAVEQSIFPYCQVENVGIMVYSPLHKGLLSGKYLGNEVFTDFRQYHPDFQGARFKTLAAQVQQLAPLAEKYHVSIYQLVLAATLCHPTVHTAIVGIKTAAQIQEAVAAAETPVSRSDYFAIRRILAQDAAVKVRDRHGMIK